MMERQAVGARAGVRAVWTFLMAVGLVGGWCATQVYRRHRNLYFLGIAHAAIGFLLFVTVPDSISHHLNIGPGQLHRLHAHRAIQ